MRFPQYRPRRLGKDDRRIIRETQVRPDDLILFLFVRPGRVLKQPIFSRSPPGPGIFSSLFDLLIEEVKEAKSSGFWVSSFLAFPKRRMNWDQKPMQKMRSLIRR
jgi:porphobilinogen synthase